MMKNDSAEQKPRRWWLGLAVGAAVSAAVTLVITIWEWLENPGGIFHDETGTRWNFVVDTAVSWFVPTFIYVAVIASALHLAWIAARTLRRKN
jgi:hypothetical protein